MTTTTIDVPTAPTIDLSTHPKAKQGGLNGWIVWFEIRRALRDKRTFAFTLVFPIAMFLLIAMQITGKDDSMGPTVIANVGAYIMVSMALYGAVMASTSAGASVSIERATGWSRQLRLTPLRPLAYIVAKICAAIVVGSVAVAAIYLTGVVTNRAHMSGRAWVLSFLIIAAGSLVFAAFGLFMGYLLPAENAMQFLGPMLALFSIFGGVFSAPIDPESGFGKIAQFTPIYGLNQLAHVPLTETTSGTFDSIDAIWLINLAVWAVIFIVGAVWRFRKDTARV